jgi:VanZ family protein
MEPDELRFETRAPAAPKPVATPVSRGVAWLSVVVWIAIIASLGGDHFSNSETSRFLGPLLQWLFPDAGFELLHSVQFAIRKAAHVFEYGILALLCMRAWRLSYRGTRWIAALASVAVVVAVAAVDEWRQAQSSDRTGAISDVALDTFAGASALLGARLASRRLTR